MPTCIFWANLTPFSLKGTGQQQHLLDSDDGSVAAAAADTRVLPAWYSHNYISLLPGESKTVEIECCAGDGAAAEQLTVEVD
jgi:hypothetical protein